MASRPIKLVDPLITLGGAAGPPVIPLVDLKCFAKGIHLMGEEDDALMTFCDPLGYSWSLSLDLLMSLGTDGLEAALNSLGGPGAVVDFEFAYVDDGTTTGTEDNPHWSGRVRISAWPIVDAQVNEPTEFTMEMDIIGDIVRDPAGPIALEAMNMSATGSPAPESAAA